jgi:hypothetical protein
LLSLAQYLLEITKLQSMKRSLLLIFLLIFTLTLNAQKDTINVTRAFTQQGISGESSNINITIYPVPVKDNSFTIKTDRDISFVKITNIIGQDVFRFQYNDPQQVIKIFLDNPKRGMYLVTIIFSDGIRVVKKIMVEQSE